MFFPIVILFYPVKDIYNTAYKYRVCVLCVCCVCGTVFVCVDRAIAPLYITLAQRGDNSADQKWKMKVNARIDYRIRYTRERETKQWQRTNNNAITAQQQRPASTIGINELLNFMIGVANL